MILSLGDLLGLHPGGVEGVLPVAGLRYGLAVVAILWAVCVARFRPVVGLLLGILYLETATGFWVVSMRRPYGLLEDDLMTRRAAQASVSVLAGGPPQGFLSGAPAEATGWEPFSPSLLPQRWLLLLPTVAPLIVLPAVALILHGLELPHRRGQMGALLWLGFSTGELESLRGMGVVPGIWTHPGPAVAMALVVLSLLLLFRVPRVGSAWPVWALLLCLTWSCVPALEPGPSLSGAVLLLTLDQGFFFPLGVFGLLYASRPARCLVLAGALLLLARGPLGLTYDAWGAHALYRLGLILAASAPSESLCERIGARLAALPLLAARDAFRLGMGALLLAFVPGSFLAWWDPPEQDPAAHASLESLPAPLVHAMEWVRRETPAKAVFVVDRAYAPALATLGGRRVLRAPGLSEREDDDARLNVEQQLMSGRAPDRLLTRYGVSHLFVAPGDFADRGLKSHEALEASPHLRLRYRNEEGFTVYEIER